MTWDEYYEKVYDGKISTAVSRKYSLNDFGDSEVDLKTESIGMEMRNSR